MIPAKIETTVTTNPIVHPEPNNFIILNADTLDVIISKLNMRALYYLHLVSKSFNQAVILNLVQRINTSRSSMMSLKLTNTDHIINVFGKELCANITKLDFSNLDEEAIKTIAQTFTNLIHLELYEDVPYPLFSLSQLKTLKSLSFNFSKNLQNLALDKIESLESLSIYYCPNISDYSLIGDCKKIKQLSLIGVTVPDLDFIENMSELESLNLTDSSILSPAPIPSNPKLRDITFIDFKINSNDGEKTIKFQNIYSILKKFVKLPKNRIAEYSQKLLYLHRIILNRIEYFKVAEVILLSRLFGELANWMDLKPPSLELAFAAQIDKKCHEFTPNEIVSLLRNFIISDKQLGLLKDEIINRAESFYGEDMETISIHYFYSKLDYGDLLSAFSKQIIDYASTFSCENIILFMQAFENTPKISRDAYNALAEALIGKVKDLTCSKIRVRLKAFSKDNFFHEKLFQAMAEIIPSMNPHEVEMIDLTNAFVACKYQNDQLFSFFAEALQKTFSLNSIVSIEELTAFATLGIFEKEILEKLPQLVDTLFDFDKIKYIFLKIQNHTLESFDTLTAFIKRAPTLWSEDIIDIANLLSDSKMMHNELTLALLKAVIQKTSFSNGADNENTKNALMSIRNPDISDYRDDVCFILDVAKHLKCMGISFQVTSDNPINIVLPKLKIVISSKENQPLDTSMTLVHISSMWDVLSEDDKISHLNQIVKTRSGAI